MAQNMLADFFQSEILEHDCTTCVITSRQWRDYDNHRADLAWGITLCDLSIYVETIENNCGENASKFQLKQQQLERLFVDLI